MNLTLDCPVCKKKLVVRTWADPAVGIRFEFDVLDGSECECDIDNDAIYAAVEDAENKAELEWEKAHPEVIEYEEEHVTTLDPEMLLEGVLLNKD